MNQSTRTLTPIMARCTRLAAPVRNPYPQRLSSLTRAWWREPSLQLPMVAVRSVQSDSSAGDKHETKDPHCHRKHDRTPDINEPDTFSEEFEHKIPSNKARPTLSDEFQHSGADEKHPKRHTSTEDAKHQEDEKKNVRKHNEDIEQRYDRAYSQISQDGEYTALDSEVDKNGKPKGE